MSTKRWILVFFVILLFCTALIFLLQTGSESQIAAVYSDGQIVRTVDLSRPDAYDFPVVTQEGGENIIRVENSAIFVVSASCADKLCIHQGPLSPTGAPIVCLPNRLVIRWQSGNAGVDAISGG